MYDWQSLLLGCMIAGSLAVIVDRFVRQTIIANTIEKDHVSQSCRDYRRSPYHIVSIFITSIVLYLLLNIWFRTLCDVQVKKAN